MADLIVILASVIIASLVAFIDILFIGPKEAFLRRILMALVGFASGSNPSKGISDSAVVILTG